MKSKSAPEPKAEEELGPWPDSFETVLALARANGIAVAGDPLAAQIAADPDAALVGEAFRKWVHTEGGSLLSPPSVALPPLL